ncbi:MAG: hypothetical protein PHW73_05970 [Atribacterota bacterium]|nr:hypothetical protein [Atribacterota bacterium]
MKKVFSDGDVDFSDEGEQARAITSEIEVNHFYSTLPKRQQIVLTYLLAGETWGNICRFLGCSEDTLMRDIRKIKNNPLVKEMKRSWRVKNK